MELSLIVVMVLDGGSTPGYLHILLTILRSKVLLIFYILQLYKSETHLQGSSGNYSEFGIVPMSSLYYSIGSGSQSWYED